MATKGCAQMTSNYTYFYDSFSSGVKTSEEEMAEVVSYCGTVNTVQKGFSAYIIKLMK